MGTELALLPIWTGSQCWLHKKHRAMLACALPCCALPTPADGIQGNRKLLQGQSFKFPDFPQFPGQEKGKGQGEL